MDTKKLTQLLKTHFTVRDLDDAITPEIRDFWINKQFNFNDCEEERFVDWLKEFLPKRIEIIDPPIQEPPGSNGRPLSHYRLRFVRSEWSDQFPNDLDLGYEYSEPTIIYNNNLS